MILSCLFQISLCLRFVPLPSSLQSIKTYNQVDRYFKEASSYFSPADIDTIKYFDDYDIFMFLDQKKLAAFLATNMTKCYSVSTRKSLDFISFYYCAITDPYRGQGLSYRIIQEAVKYLKDTYNLTGDTVLALHVSPKDEMMPVAAKVYYSIGFKKGLFIRSSPIEMIYQIDTVFEKSRDLMEVADDENVAYGDGYYFMIYCRLKDFHFQKSKPNNGKTNNVKINNGNILEEKTKKIFEIMKRRRNSKLM